MSSTCCAHAGLVSLSSDFANCEPSHQNGQLGAPPGRAPRTSDAGGLGLSGRARYRRLGQDEKFILLWVVLEMIEHADDNLSKHRTERRYPNLVQGA